jgi:hypothetical protein
MREISLDALSYDYFMAYANIIRELRCFAYYKPAEIFKRYREYILRSDQHRADLSTHSGFTKMVGFSVSDLAQLYSEHGMVLVLIHYGAYRHAVASIFECLMERSNGLKKDVLIVVDQESYTSEQQVTSWKDLHVRMNVNCRYIIAENPMIGLQIMRHLQRGGVVVLYLDGMTGVGEDKSPIILPFISSHVRFRSGFFRLLAKIRIPVVGIISTDDDSTLLVSAPIDPIDEVMTVSTLVSFFRAVLLREPSQWRLWYRHHLFVETTPVFKEPYVNGTTTPRWICRDVEPHLVLEEETGNVYQWLDQDGRFYSSV